MKSLRFAVAAAALVAALPAAASRIAPAEPTAFEPVTLRMTVDSCAFAPSTVRVQNAASVIKVTQQPNQCLVAGTPQLADVRLGSLPIGDYRVEVYASPNTDAAPAETFSFTVRGRAEVAVFPPPPHPLTDYSGLWWDPSRPGFGLAVYQNPVSDALFGAWYVYDGAGAPTWFTLQGGQWTSSTRWTGKAFRTSLGPNGELSIAELGGNVEFDFTDLPRDGGSARFTFNLPANGGALSIVRFPLQ